jgi:hypothetical protein
MINHRHVKIKFLLMYIKGHQIDKHLLLLKRK